MKLKSQAHYVLDASALMALINGETGADFVEAHLEKGCISSVNLAEVLSKMLERGVPIGDAKGIIDNFNLEVIPFDEDQIVGTSLLRVDTRPYGLSLADRICLNLGKILHLPVLTGDQAWAKVEDPDLKVILLR